MLERGRIGSRDAREGGAARHLLIALIGAAQLAILAIAPRLDPPPAPTGHRHHLAAESAGGCQVYHDEHCVLCRVIATDGVGGSIPAVIPVARPSFAAARQPCPEAVPDTDRVAPRQARAPPIA
ncbi:MAG TPA: hypothetical protein VMM12_08580 [Longimicrobiales bacterium]|nr:hypothetical protein [Longimicrobiales bacterium]